RGLDVVVIVDAQPRTSCARRDLARIDDLDEVVLEPRISRVREIAILGAFSGREVVPGDGAGHRRARHRDEVAARVALETKNATGEVRDAQDAIVRVIRIRHRAPERVDHALEPAGLIVNHAKRVSAAVGDREKPPRDRRSVERLISIARAVGLALDERSVVIDEETRKFADRRDESARLRIVEILGEAAGAVGADDVARPGERKQATIGVLVLPAETERSLERVTALVAAAKAIVDAAAADHEVGLVDGELARVRVDLMADDGALGALRHFGHARNRKEDAPFDRTRSPARRPKSRSDPCAAAKLVRASRDAIAIDLRPLDREPTAGAGNAMEDVHGRAR